MPEGNDELAGWIAACRRKLAEGTLLPADLERFAVLAPPVPPTPRQRLLYLHAREPSVTAHVVAWAEHPGEDPGGQPPERPYATVMDALADGWRALHFPQQLAPFDDRETDIVGYEFILEKWQ